MQVRTYHSARNVAAADATGSAAVFMGVGRALGLREPADAWLLFGTLAYIGAVFLSPNMLTIGLGIWWLLNTVSHNFIHQPFFKSRAINRAFAIYLSVLTLVPHRLWRDKHFAHHADRSWRLKLSSELCVQLTFVALFWSIALTQNPRFTIFALVPGFLIGMALCTLHGYFEHASGTTSHYGALYNHLFFNDGFHVEHHEQPSLHWSALPRARQKICASRWPAVLRWCAWVNLNSLESLVTRSPVLQRWVISAHTKAVRKLAVNLPAPKQVAIVGGGLFPRTALVVHAIWPAAQVTIIDSNAGHLERSRVWLRGDEILLHAHVTPETLPDGDIIFIPLAFDQDRRPLYEAPNRGCILIHDWLWNRNNISQTAVASVLLLKRLNLVMR
jgi:hypothetical protein